MKTVIYFFLLIFMFNASAANAWVIFENPGDVKRHQMFTDSCDPSKQHLIDSRLDIISTIEKTIEDNKKEIEKNKGQLKTEKNAVKRKALNKEMILSREIIKEEGKRLQQKLKELEKIEEESDCTNEDCEKYCGAGYTYVRNGCQLGFKECVCLYYPLDCGYNCTEGWSLRPLVNNSKYTCQEAIQDPDYRRNAENNGDENAKKKSGRVSKRKTSKESKKRTLIK